MLNSTNDLQQLYDNLCEAVGACPYQRFPSIMILILVIDIDSIHLHAFDGNFFYSR